MIIVEQTAGSLKRYLEKSLVSEYARLMVMRMVLAFLLHRGRMSCSSAAGMIASRPMHRGQVTRFLARPRWQKVDFNQPLRAALLQLESGKGKFIFIVDLTLFSQAGVKSENTYSTGNRERRKIKKGSRYNKKKTRRKKVHGFTFGLLITPSGYRIPFQTPHYTKEYSKKKGITPQTSAQAMAEMIRQLPLDEEAEVVVLGDTAYDARCVQEACDERGYIWITPANAERVYAGPTGERPKLRSRLKDWTGMSLKTIRLRASTGKYADYRRLSRWRVGPKTKTRTYYAHQEKRNVHNVGCVGLVFSTMKPNLEKATPNDVKILMTNATGMSVTEVIELYSLRWQIELFFKELKSTLGVGQYQFEKFEAVVAWINCAITTVLFLEQLRARKLADRRLSEERRRWWVAQRIHGLSEAFHQQCTGEEMNYLAKRLETSGGVQKMKRLLMLALPKEFRSAV